MSDGNGATLRKDPFTEETFPDSKGKGKATAEDVPHDDAMDDDDEDDDDDDEEDDEDANAERDEDGMEEIDLNNIVEGGRRTRGAKIDFAKAAEQHPADEDDDEDDDDFEPNEDTEMAD